MLSSLSVWMWDLHLYESEKLECLLLSLLLEDNEVDWPALGQREEGGKLRLPVFFSQSHQGSKSPEQPRVAGGFVAYLFSLQLNCRVLS